MLEPILKGLMEWLYEMMVDIMAYASGELIGVMSMDFVYFERTAPIISEIVNVFIALGWALLIGNLVFQLLKVIMSGVGFEAEDPKILFIRSFVFAFLLLASKQICQIGSSMTGMVISMLNLPGSITVTVPDESMFSLGSGAKWLLVIIVGVVLMVQMVKLLFEIGERYVITSVLTFFAPLAFAMGGSKNTNDIFKGWCRMYASMLIMMIMNIVFLKLIMSAMSQMAAGGVLVWLVFVVALTRVARKIDSHIGKIGLNPAQTGSGIGSRIPGAMTMMAIKVMKGAVSRSMAGGKSSSGENGFSGSKGNSSNRTGSRFRGAYSGNSHTTNNTTDNSSSKHSGENRTAYAGSVGNTNVNSMGNSANSSGVSMQEKTKQNTAGSKSHMSISEKTIGGSQGRNSESKDTTNQEGQNNGGIYHIQKASSLHGKNSMRPPISRNTGSSNPSADTPTNNTMQNSKNNKMNEIVANNKDDVRIDENTQRHTKKSDNQNFTNSGGDYSNKGQERAYIQKQGRTTTPEQRINHEYKQGKFDPAALNKKAKNTFYKKDDLQQKQNYEKKKDRGENDRKQKR